MASLLLTPAPGQGEFLKYTYRSGQLFGAENKNGNNVNVDASGIPV